jgi:hypothetical protein
MQGDILVSTFTTPLQLEFTGKGRRKFTLLSSFEYHIGEYPATDQEDIISVPEGFRTDFASVPRIFWPIVSPIDEYAKAAVLHDWLYNQGEFSRKKCDDIFDEAMKVLNTPKWKRIVVYYAVRWFAMFAWNNARKRNET